MFGDHERDPENVEALKDVVVSFKELLGVRQVLVETVETTRQPMAGKNLKLLGPDGAPQRETLYTSRTTTYGSIDLGRVDLSGEANLFGAERT